LALSNIKSDPTAALVHEDLVLKICAKLQTVELFDD